MRRSFTLIEVLVAMAIVLALVGTMYSFLFDLMSSRRSVLEHVRQETATSALISQLEAALSTCIVGDRASGSGVAGDERHIRVLSRGVAASLAARGVDDPDVFGDLQVSEYRFDPARQRIEGRRMPIGGSGLRRGNGAEFTPLEGVVHNVRFRFYDGEQWLSTFDSMTHNQLPVAVEVAVWFSPVSDETDPIEYEEISPDHDADSIPSDEGSPDETRERESASPRSSGDQPAIPPDRVRVLLIPDAKKLMDSSSVESSEPTTPEGGANE